LKINAQADKSAHLTLVSPLAYNQAIIQRKMVAMEQPGLNVVSLFVIEDSGQEVLVSPVLDTHPAFIIGGDLRNHLHLDDSAVVSGHALVTRKDGNYFIEARYRDKPIDVNGKVVNARIPLKPGDAVQIGAAKMRFAQEERRTQATSIKPAVTQQALIPATTAKALVFSPPPASMIAASSSAIYYPKSRNDQQGESVPLLLMVLVGIGVMLFLGYQLLTGGNSGSTAVTARPYDYAYDDGNIVVLMFEIGGCEDCEALKPILTSALSDYRGDAFLYIYNLDNPIHLSFIDKYELVTAPTIVILDDQGKVFDTLVGSREDAQLRAVFDEALRYSAAN
jgi:hypothetical protein